MARKNNRLLQSITVICGLALCISAFQYYQVGQINWYQDPLNSTQDLMAGLDELVPDTASSSTSGVEIQGQVSSITDGDTLRINNTTGGSDIIRLYGIDAPERDQPYGTEATKALSSKVADAKVRIVVQDTDDYGRQVGTVYLDHRNINLEMVAQGHAWWYEFFVPDNRELRQAHIKAQESHLGLWRDTNPVEPYDWRRSH
jgi:endonuclease YncB( thermonuclease family)